MSESTPKKKSGMLSNILTILLVTFAAFWFLWPSPLLKLGYSLAETGAGMGVKSVQAAGHRIVYSENSAKKKPPLVLVHGYATGRENWSFLIGKLTSRYRLVALDLPGWGESERKSNENYSISNQAERLASFLTAVGVEKPVLAGSSLGGAISAYFAALYPERVSKLILLDSLGVTAPEKSEWRRIYETGTNFLIPAGAEEFKTLLSNSFYKQPWIPKPFRKAMSAKYMDDYIWNAKMWKDYETPSAPLEPLLAKIRAQTLIIWGSEDRIVHPSASGVFAKGISNARSVLIPDCGHSPQIEKANETAKLILDFAGGK